MLLKTKKRKMFFGSFFGGSRAPCCEHENYKLANTVVTMQDWSWSVYWVDRDIAIDQVWHIHRRRWPRPDGLCTRCAQETLGEQCEVEEEQQHFCLARQALLQVSGAHIPQERKILLQSTEIWSLSSLSFLPATTYNKSHVDSATTLISLLSHFYVCCSCNIDLFFFVTCPLEIIWAA